MLHTSYCHTCYHFSAFDSVDQRRSQNHIIVVALATILPIVVSDLKTITLTPHPQPSSGRIRLRHVEVDGEHDLDCPCMQANLTYVSPEPYGVAVLINGNMSSSLEV